MRKITASEGKYFTQKNIETESARAFAITLYLADNDSADNWREATQEEFYAWQKKMEEGFEKQSLSDGSEVK